MTYTLYGAEVSYFTGKARAFLDWKRVDYSEKPATRDVYREIIVPRIGWPVIPVVCGPDDELLQDTSDIIDLLDARHGPPSVFPETPVQKLVALLLELFGDEWLVLPAMHYRWTYNRDFAYREFGRLSAPDATDEEQYEIGRANATNFEGALPMLGVDARTAAAIETGYCRMLDELDAHFAAHEMLLGSRPSIGDFGLFGPLYAHQFRDPESGKLMQERAPNLVRWVKTLRDNKAARPGAFLEGDTVPETLLSILRTQMQDQFPCLADTARALADWAKDQKPGTPVPRALGKHAFTTHGARGERMIFPFNLWMLQRPIEHYRSLSGGDRDTVEAFLSGIGGEAFSRFPDFPRLERVDYRLVLA
ncbi:MAG: glutathione S-transferase [Alphaproteobacteria bacterium]|nr:glutathione S-transferase [Alphaproteobacteria bacterium]